MSHMLRKPSRRQLLSVAGLTLTVGVAGLVAGCGGTTYSGNSGGLITPNSYPYVYGYGDNDSDMIVSAFASGSVVNGVYVPPTVTNPLASDTFQFTFPESNSNPSGTLPGAGTFITGIDQGVDSIYIDPTNGIYGTGGPFAPLVAPTSDSNTGAPTSYALNVIPTVKPGSTYVFRMEGAQGDNNGTPQDITKVSLTAFGTSQTVVFGLDPNTAAGPFDASAYAASVTVPGGTANGLYPVVATITDAANHTTSTTFDVLVLQTGFAGLASNSYNTFKVNGATPTQTFTASDGSVIDVFPVGTYNVTVQIPSFQDASGNTVAATTFTTNVPLTAQAVTMVPIHATGTVSFARPKAHGKAKARAKWSHSL